MTKANRAGAQQPDDGGKSGAKAASTGRDPEARGESTPSGAAAAKPTSKGKQSGKSNRPVIGGTAVAGAKSTQPKAVAQSNSPQQQAENYNRSMRRRMQKLGTGPYSENLAVTAQERRQKRIERKKRKSAELRQQVTRGQRVNLSLGKRNTYFLIAMAALLVIIIVIAIIIRHPF
jgi:hypothetical protein